MAKKKLGYVELEWSCPVCQTRNPGLRQTCASCGSPQPKDAKFEAPIQTELIQDADKIKRAQVGPDIHCGYCGARNPADAKVCHQCGGDLTQGTARTAGDVLDAPLNTGIKEVRCATCGTANPITAQNCSTCGAALAKPKVQPTPTAAKEATSSRGCVIAAILIGILLVGGIIAFMVFSNRTTAVTGTVREANWTRTITIEGLTPVQYSDWRDEIPAGAEIGRCEADVRSVQDTPTQNSREVCGTPYTVDTGTGLGEVVQDCQYEVYADRCTYTVEEWRTVDTLVLNGKGFTPQWPTAALAAQQRTGERTEGYQCVLSANDEEYTYTPQNWEQYRQCEPGSQWTLEVNTFGSIMSLAPAD